MEQPQQGSHSHGHGKLEKIKSRPGPGKVMPHAVLWKIKIIPWQKGDSFLVHNMFGLYFASVILLDR